MKPLKHFCRAFLHLFTFLILMHFINNLHEFTEAYSDMQVWFLSLITLCNAFMGGYHFAWFVRTTYTNTQLKPVNDWDGEWK